MRREGVPGLAAVHSREGSGGCPVGPGVLREDGGPWQDLWARSRLRPRTGSQAQEAAAAAGPPQGGHAGGGKGQVSRRRGAGHVEVGGGGEGEGPGLGWSSAAGREC